MPSDLNGTARTAASLRSHVLNDTAPAEAAPVESPKSPANASDIDRLGGAAPARDAGPQEPSKEYIVFMPRDAGAQAASNDGLANLMRAKQDTKQSALSCNKRGRFVVNLTKAEVSEYERAGMKILENFEVKAPEPVEAHEEEFRAENAVARSAHGADVLQAREPGWEGENALVVIADTGIAKHNQLSDTVLFDDVATPAPSDPQRDSGRHGTHVAGIAAATGDGQNSVRGIAPKAKLAGALVLDGGSGSLATVMAGIEKTIEWANSPEWKDKPVILNMSLGATAAGDRELDALAELANEAMREHGIFVVSSEGNSGPGLGTIGTPAVGEDVVAVAATDHRRTARTDDDRIANFSSRGDPNGRPGQNDKPDIAAGGANVLSTVPGNRTARLSGTSMASPQVAGAGAALLSKFYDLWKAGETRISPRELVQSGEFLKLLTETAEDVDNQPKHVDGAGDMRMVEAADLMIERFTIRNVISRETAFKEIIASLKEDDGELTVRDQDEILQSLVELTESLDRADDRIDFLTRALAIASEEGNGIDATTGARIQSVATELASESAMLVASERPLTSAKADLAWSTMMSWRTPGTAEENPMASSTSNSRDSSSPPR
ncbi:MAG: S8 family serine peptidase [Myxococcota bacterium]